MPIARAFLALCALAVFAQFCTTTVPGAVTDAPGATIPGTTVTITNAGTNLSHRMTTDAAGLYGVTVLPPGMYTVSTEMPGFRKSCQESITLYVRVDTRIDSKIEGGAITETTTVETEERVLQTDDVTISAVATVGEFKVLTNSYNAEYGQTVGGVIDMPMKPGTNEYHVTGFEFQHNNVFDVQHWSTKGQPLRLKYGHTVGGPVQIPKIYNGLDKPRFFLSQRPEALISTCRSTAGTLGGDPFADNVVPQARYVHDYWKIPPVLTASIGLREACYPFRRIPL